MNTRTGQHSLLQCVADCLGILLEQGQLGTKMQRLLARVGRAAAVDRVYVFENEKREGQLCCSQRYEWVRDSTSSHLEDPELQHIPYAHLDSEVLEYLLSGSNYARLTKDLSQGFRNVMEPQNIVSFVFIPMTVQGGLLGFIGVGDCSVERQWKDDEMDSLRAVAAGVGSAILRERGDIAAQIRAEESARSRRVALSLMEDARKATEAAEAANNAKSSFLAMMSHELRTPLNGVIGFTNLLMSEPLQPQVAERVEIIRNCGHSLLALIDDILDLSKIEAGRLQLAPAPFALQTCLDDVIRSFGAVVNQKGLEIRCDMDPSVPSLIVADEKRLRQIFFNLVGNAVKFTAAGIVSIKVQANPLERNRTALLCTVSDTGIGIPAEAQQGIFEAFGQAHSAIHQDYGGSGLGLTICRRLLQAMGGRISVMSMVGQGTMFTFDLVVTNAPRPSVPIVPPIRKIILAPNLRILAVDDVSTNLMLIKAILERLGYTPTLASDGREAVELARNNKFDAIFMDVLMPVCDGIEATCQIRKDEQQSSERMPTRIIALTADALPENRQKCLDAGMDEFLTKPLRVSDIQSALETVSPRTSTSNNRF